MKKTLFLASLCCALTLFVLSCQNTPKETFIIEPAAKPETFTIDSVTFTMLGIEGGTFTMGAAMETPETYPDELPAHKVTLSSFMLGETEVTQALWEAVMDYNPSCFQYPDFPVDNVSWEECQDFISRLNELTHKHFRLPTEAEWEYACRGGNTNHHTRFCGSDTLDIVGWNKGNCKEPHPVRRLQPSLLGLYDMSGNVWEWCSDYFDNYLEEEQKNPQGPEKGTYRVFRGGSWFGAERSTRISTRDRFLPDESNYNLGFRLALTDPASAIHRR